MYRTESLRKKKQGSDKTTAEKVTGAANERPAKSERTVAVRATGASNDRPGKKTIASTATKQRASPETSSTRREFYAKELGPIPEYYVSDVTNNARQDSGPERRRREVSGHTTAATDASPKTTKAGVTRGRASPSERRDGGA